MSQVTRKLALLLLIVFGLFLFIHSALAQDRWGLGLFETKEEFVHGGAESVIVNVVMWMMSIIGIIAVAFVIYGGIMYATSSGNEQQIEKAKKILLYAIIGLVIAILALTIATFVTRVVRGGEWCLKCQEYNPEIKEYYYTYTPFETEEACREALRQSDCFTCLEGPCPSP